MNIPTLLRCFALVTVAAIPARAQLRLDWSTTYATPTSDTALVARIDSAGNVYTAGIGNADTGQLDGTAFVAAWTATGVPLWSTTFDATLGRAEFPNAIEFDNAGGVYVAGVATGPSFGVYAGFLLHLDATGAITWSIEQPTTTTGSFGSSLVVDAQGRAIVGSRVPAGSGDLAITAYTPAGGVAWQSTYAGTAGGADAAVALALAPNGEIVAIGTVNSTVPSSSKPVLVRLASDGTVLQTLEIATPELQSGAGVDIEVDASGRIYAAVNGRAPGAPVTAMMLLAFDTQGALAWLRSITGQQQPFGGGSYARDLEIDAFGRAVLLGGRAQGSSGIALVVAAYDVNGNEAWRTIVNDVLGGPSVNLWNHANRVLLDASGEATVVGSYGPALADTVSDAFALAVDSGGKKRFGLAYGFPPTPGGSFDHGIGAAAGAGQTFVIAGRAQTSSSSTGFDAFVAQFTRTASGFCFGDGAVAACPCGNASAAVERAGCASSLGIGGRLADLGASSLANDTLTLVGSSMPNTITVYYQGTIAGAGTAFGDGLACLRGNIVRLGETFNVAGTSQFPGSGGLPISVHGQVSSPGMRVYQAVYRNAASFCTDKAFNTTNGMQVTWIP